MQSVDSLRDDITGAMERKDFYKGAKVLRNPKGYGSCDAPGIIEGTQSRRPENLTCQCF